MKTTSTKLSNNIDSNDLIKLEEIINLVNTTPNDMDLGKLIRELFNDGE